MKEEKKVSDEIGGGLIKAIDALTGGAATAAITALVMRLVYHGQEATNRRRKWFGMELLLEPLIAVAMALLGDAIGTYAGLSHAATIGVIGVLAWVGPRGAQKLIERWVDKKIGAGK
jgi:hypothetical protein